MIRFSLFRIPIGIHWMFWLLAAFLGGGLRALENPSSRALSLVAIFMVAALVSIVAHELGHALTGLKLGARRVEIELHGMGGHARFFGSQFTDKQNIIVTAAGPGASIALAGVAYVLILVTGLGSGQHTLSEAYVAYFLSTMVIINVFWSIVNLMPVLPLDGGQILASALGRDRLRLTCIISFVTVALLAVALWFWTRSVFNLVIMGFLASHTMQVWKSLPPR